MAEEHPLTIIEFISRYRQLNESEREFIQATNRTRSFSKGTILLSEGQIARETYVVLKGCIRSYYLSEGEELTTDFFTENELIVPVGYTDRKPSAYYLECMEDCVVSSGREETTKAFLEEHPEYKGLCLDITNDLMSRKQASADAFKTLSPELRYLSLLESRPDLIQRVPQYHIASFLGIKPQSLSRIRKRLVVEQRL